MTPRRAAFAAALVLSLATPLAHARQTGRSTLDVRVDPADARVRATLELPARDLAHYLRIDADADRAYTAADITGENQRGLVLDFLNSHMAVMADATPCPRKATELVEPTRDDVDFAATLTFACPTTIDTLRVTHRAMTNDRWGYQHLGTLHGLDGSETKHVFDNENPTLSAPVGLAIAPPEPNPLEAPAPFAAFALILLAGLGAWAWNRR